MADSSSLAGLPHSSTDGVLELNRDLEKMIENAENASVELTWMAYDMVCLRTSSELWLSMQKLEEAVRGCRAVICGGDPDRELEPSTGPDPPASTHTQM